jgi:hypothetical protein
VKRALNRAPLILAVPLTALTLVACGDDDDEPTVTEADVTVPDVSISSPEISLPDEITIPSLPDISLPDISVGEQVNEFLRDALGDLGLNDDQIDCLIEQIDPSSGQVPDVSEMMDLFGECDIEISDLQPSG